MATAVLRIDGVLGAERGDGLNTGDRDAGPERGDGRADGVRPRRPLVLAGAVEFRRVVHPEGRPDSQ